MEQITFNKTVRAILNKTRKMMARNLLIESMAIINLLVVLYFLSEKLTMPSIGMAFLYFSLFVIYRSLDVVSISRQLLATRKFTDEYINNLGLTTEKSFARSFIIKLLIENMNRDRTIGILKDKISIIQSSGTMFPKNTLKIYFVIVVMLFIYAISTISFLFYWTNNPNFNFDSDTFFWMYKVSFGVISLTIGAFLIVLWKIVWGSKVVDICMSCRSVHWNSKWTQFEEFIGSSTHTICPSCTVQKLERSQHDNFQGLLSKVQEAGRSSPRRGYRGRDEIAKDSGKLE